MPGAGGVITYTIKFQSAAHRGRVHTASAEGDKAALYLQSILREILGLEQYTPTAALIYEDNMGALFMATVDQESLSTLLGARILTFFLQD